jgi:hypothetical protein
VNKLWKSKADGNVSKSMFNRNDRIYNGIIIPHLVLFITVRGKAHPVVFVFVFITSPGPTDGTVVGRVIVLFVLLLFEPVEGIER